MRRDDIALVFRVESQYGHGPYHEYRLLSSYCSQEISEAYRNVLYEHETGAYWDAPTQDGFYFVDPKHVFGFSCLTTLCKWFRESDRKILAQANLFIAVYRCPAKTIVKGKKQCTFDKARAMKLGTLSLDSENVDKALKALLSSAPKNYVKPKKAA